MSLTTASADEVAIKVGATPGVETFDHVMPPLIVMKRAPGTVPSLETYPTIRLTKLMVGTSSPPL
jgi:hypothetical protein